MGSGGMQQCMNCGGPVWDSETKCTTCGLHRRDVIFGEWSKWHSCSQCGELFRGSQSVCEECGESQISSDSEFFDDDEAFESDDDDDEDVEPDAGLL